MAARVLADRLAADGFPDRLEELAGKQYRSNYILEERHTDQIDYNFAASVQHEKSAMIERILLIYSLF